MDPARKTTDSANAPSRLVSMADMMANGMVWVSPVRFPANIMVAPNSDKALAHARPRPVTMAGAASGNVIRKKVRQGETPKVCATSS